MSAGAHVLLFPFPALGHLIPLLDLAHHLAIRGLTITILVTPKNLHILNPLLSKNSTINTLVFPFPNYPSIPFGIENLKDLPPNIRPTSMIHALGELYQPLLTWFRSHPSPPVAIRKQLGHDRVWAVGPILPKKTIDMTPPERGGSSTVSMHDLKTWLYTCEDHKVVYVCYGTQVLLTKDQMEAVASGLEKSGVHFIWCVKQPSKELVGEGYSMIPSGFEDRVAGSGLIIRGWSPQGWILSHRAVGAFLTHCGWNSILEGIVAGVPMLACPMGADQFVDATLMVEELKGAKRVCDGANVVSHSAKLARTLMESVSDESRVEKERAKELRMAAVDAIKEDGSSDKNLNAFVKHVVGLGSETDEG